MRPPPARETVRTRPGRKFTTTHLQPSSPHNLVSSDGRRRPDSDSSLGRDAIRQRLLPECYVAAAFASAWGQPNLVPPTEYAWASLK